MFGTSWHVQCLFRLLWLMKRLLLTVLHGVLMAFFWHIVHVYSYRDGDELRDHIEIEAHVGNFNDIVFTIRNRGLSLLAKWLFWSWPMARIRQPIQGCLGVLSKQPIIRKVYLFCVRI